MSPLHRPRPSCEIRDKANRRWLEEQGAAVRPASVLRLRHHGFVRVSALACAGGSG
jgi:hypothetical protein